MAGLIDEKIDARLRQFDFELPTALPPRLPALSGVLPVLTEDPVSPADPSAWVFLDGGTPETAYLRIYRSGTTWSFPVGTLVS